ncbi:MAG: hypothetical protein HC769_23415 [Cyanobacteria bacterium CRU_2_1]|nr:hypothetical protein [Cyanobacteria bacterium CRU_2_1]
MLFSLIALAIAIATISISHRWMDDITRLLLRLAGLFSLFLSLVYSPWLIKLLIVVAIFVTPDCTHWHSLGRIRCSPLCVARPNCPYLPI